MSAGDSLGRQWTVQPQGRHPHGGEYATVHDENGVEAGYIRHVDSSEYGSPMRTVEYMYVDPAYRGQGAARSATAGRSTGASWPDSGTGMHGSRSRGPPAAGSCSITPADRRIFCLASPTTRSARQALMTGKGVSTAIDLRERYVTSWDGTEPVEAEDDAEYAILYREGRCKSCKETARSREGRVVTTANRPPAARQGLAGLAQMPEINLTEEEAIEAIVKVLNERRDWLPRNPYGVTALILDALGWPRSNSRQMKP